MTPDPDVCILLLSEDEHDHCAEILERHFQARHVWGLTDASTKEAFYGFRPSDVTSLYTHHREHGSGLYFRLRDGRVFDVTAQACDPAPDCYYGPRH